MSGIAERLRLALVLAALLACGAANPPSENPERCTGAFVAEASDFPCVLDLPRVGPLRVINLCGRQAEAEAQLSEPREGAEIPVGTIIMVTPNEAMVKRGGEFDPEFGDWEYITLERKRDRTEIAARGRAEVSNIGGSCRNCHSNASSHDFVCKLGGCPGIPGEVVAPLQYFDRRCLGR